MGLGLKRIMTGGTDGGHGRDILVVIRVGLFGFGQHRCRQRIFIYRQFKRIADVTAGAVSEIIKAGGHPDFTEVVNAASETIDDDAVFAIPVFFGSTRVDGMNHVLKVDGFLHLAVGANGTAAGAYLDVGGVGVVADDTYLRLVGAIVAVQAQRTVAGVAIGDSHYSAAFIGWIVRNGEIHKDIGNRHAVRIVSVSVEIPGRMPFDGRHSASGDVFGNRIG